MFSKNRSGDWMGGGVEGRSKGNSTQGTWHEENHGWQRRGDYVNTDYAKGSNETPVDLNTNHTTTGGRTAQKDILKE